jgi:hypothetical protein
MPEQLTELAIVRAQRNQLAANLHDLHVSHQLTLAALAETNARLAAAEARLATYGSRMIIDFPINTPIEQPVAMASEADADSAA